jgi:hypothetical protein
MRKALAAAMLGLMVGAVPATDAGTILSVSGMNNGGFSIGGLNPSSFSQVVGLSWSQTQGYSDVAIGVPILIDVPAGDIVDAYLVRGTVPQPQSSEIAHTSFTLPNIVTVVYEALFSGLDLGPGTYSVVLSSLTSIDNRIGWLYSAGPTIVEDTGVTLLNMAYTSFDTSPPSYPPDDPNFRPNNTAGATLNIAVFGTAAPNPEPTSLVLGSLAGLIGLGYACYRRLRR